MSSLEHSRSHLVFRSSRKPYSKVKCISDVQLVLVTGLGNLPVVRFLAGDLVWFSSLPGQKPHPQCLSGFVTRPDINPRLIGHVGTEPQFQHFGSHTFASY